MPTMSPSTPQTAAHAQTIVKRSERVMGRPAGRETTQPRGRACGTGLHRRGPTRAKKNPAQGRGVGRARVSLASGRLRALVAAGVVGAQRGPEVIEPALDT